MVMTFVLKVYRYGFLFVKPCASDITDKDIEWKDLQLLLEGFLSLYPKYILTICEEFLGISL